MIVDGTCQLASLSLNGPYTRVRQAGSNLTGSWRERNATEHPDRTDGVLLTERSTAMTPPPAAMPASCSLFCLARREQEPLGETGLFKSLRGSALRSERAGCVRGDVLSAASPGTAEQRAERSLGCSEKKTLLVNKAAFLKDRKGLQVAVGAREEVPTCTPYGRSSEASPTLRRSAETLKSLFKAVFLTFS